ncbi:MAG: hypothetical protein AAB648_01775 [Patescibacteria group bacterium]
MPTDTEKAKILVVIKDREKQEEALRTSDRLCGVIIKNYEKRRAEIETRLENISLIKSFLLSATSLC